MGAIAGMARFYKWAPHIVDGCRCDPGRERIPGAFGGGRVREQARSYEKQKARTPMKVHGLRCG